MWDLDIQIDMLSKKREKITKREYAFAGDHPVHGFFAIAV